jgi:hypothetical protein
LTPPLSGPQTLRPATSVAPSAGPVTPRCALTGRISHQLRAWFDGPWHLGLRAWSAALLCLGGRGVDGHVEAEGLELAEVGTDLALTACLLVVPAGPEVGEPGGGVGEELPDDDEDGASDGAFGLVPAEPPGQPAEPLAEERAGVRGAVCGLGAVALEVCVVLSLLRFALPGPDWNRVIYPGPSRR